MREADRKGVEEQGWHQGDKGRGYGSHRASDGDLDLGSDSKNGEKYPDECSRWEVEQTELTENMRFLSFSLLPGLRKPIPTPESFLPPLLPSPFLQRLGGGMGAGLVGKPWLSMP